MNWRYIDLYDNIKMAFKHGKIDNKSLAIAKRSVVSDIYLITEKLSSKILLSDRQTLKHLKRINSFKSLNKYSVKIYPKNNLN